MPASDHPHPLHGFGWLSNWSTEVVAEGYAKIVHVYDGPEWPCRYEAEQEFELHRDRVVLSLTATNRSDLPMPCGLGFHPYFERDSDTIYYALHRGEWQTSRQGLPIALGEAASPIDWWDGMPIGTRSVDTVYEDRLGPITVVWPSRGFTVELTPSDDLRCTAIYTPAGADFFCIEPVSQATDAINRDPGSITMLAPGESMKVVLTIRASG